MPSSEGANKYQAGLQHKKRDGSLYIRPFFSIYLLLLVVRLFLGQALTEVFFELADEFFV
jgi:hypothetical protein